MPKQTVALSVIVIASVGLIIGGVGVMNIMLASVTERNEAAGRRRVCDEEKFNSLGMASGV